MAAQWELRELRSRLRALNSLVKDNSKKTKQSNSHPDVQALGGWLTLQKSLAQKTGLALTTMKRDGVTLGPVDNNNSICALMMGSAELSARCALDCGHAWTRSNESPESSEFRCHAGLRCFAVRVESLQATITGGRAFTSTADYKHFHRTYGDLLEAAPPNSLTNVKFIPYHEFREATSLILESARYSTQTDIAESRSQSNESRTLRHLLESHRFQHTRTGHLEIVPHDEDRIPGQWSELLRDVSAAPEIKDSYQNLLVKLSEMLKAQRSSLMILNDETNELSLEATYGFVEDLPSPVRIKVGDPIAGAVLASGKALLVQDVFSDSRITGTRRRHYSARSFISFPIRLGSRRLGVMNFTNRSDGEYTEEDLGAVEIIGPHIALLVDHAEWRKKAERFQQMSLTDALTGLPNRRYLDERLFEEVERSKRHGTPLAFMIVDIDRFKTYNDMYGHTNADNVLVKTAQSLRRLVRAIDMSARFAGDEFCIVLPETSTRDAVRIAERLRSEVSQADYRSEQGESLGRVTISIGISAFGPARQSALEIIEAADRALYQAKMRGRDCVAVYDDSSTGH